MSLSGYNARPDSRSEYLNLEQIFAAYRGAGINAKAAATAMLSGGQDLSDLFDPTNSAIDRITFDTGYKANAVTNSPDLRTLYRAINISPTPTPVVPTPTPTPTPAPSTGNATVDITGEQTVRWYPNAFAMNSIAASTSSIISHTIEVRSGPTNPPTGAYTTILSVNPAAASSNQTVNYTPNQGPGYYQFRATIEDGSGPRTPVLSGVVNIINNIVAVDISSTTPTLGTFGPITLTSNAASNNVLANLKTHGFEWFNGSYWQNIGANTVNVQNSTQNQAAPTVSSYGTWYYRAYASNCDNYQQIGSYQYTVPFAVVYAAIPTATYSLNLTQSPDGAPYGSTTGGGTYDVNNITQRSILATPNAANGYAFSTWSGDTSYLVNVATNATNSVVVSALSPPTSVNLLATFAPAVATSPSWLNVGFVSPDTYSTTDIVKIFVDGTSTASFDGTLHNPNAYLIYVNTTANNAYGISFGDSQVNVGIFANNNSTWSANYDGTVTYSDTPLTAGLVVDHIGNSRTFQAVIPASIYLTNANKVAYQSAANKYQALDQSITITGNTGSFTLNNVNIFAVTLEIVGLEGTAAVNGVVRWYTDSVSPGNLLAIGSTFTVPAGSTRNIYWVADAWYSSPYVYQTREEAKVTFRGLNSNVTHRVVMAEPSYVVTSGRWGAWLNSNSVWQVCYANNATAPVGSYSLNRAWAAPTTGTYLLSSSADNSCVTYIDDVLAISSNEDYASLTIGSIYLEAGMHIIAQHVTNKSGTSNNPAGFYLAINDSTNSTNLYNSRLGYINCQ